MSSQSIAIHPSEVTGTQKDLVRAVAKPPVWSTQLLVLIDRRHARILKVRSKDGVPQQVIPYDPFGFRRGRHLVWNDPAADQGASSRFREAIATTLRGSERVLVVANGTRANLVASQVMDHFKTRHPDLSSRLIGSMVVDDPDPSADTLLATVWEFQSLFAAASPNN